MYKNALKWGALLGVGLSLLEPVKMYAKLLEYNARPIFDLLTIVLFIALIFKAQKEYKDNNDGEMSFSRSFGIGILVTLVAFVIFLCYSMLHFSFINKEALQSMYNGEITNVLAGAMLYSMFYLLYGLLFDIFTSMYLYKKKENREVPTAFTPGYDPNIMETDSSENNKEDNKKSDDDDEQMLTYVQH